MKQTEPIRQNKKQMTSPKRRKRMTKPSTATASSVTSSPMTLPSLLRRASSFTSWVTAVTPCFLTTSPDIKRSRFLDFAAISCATLQRQKMLVNTSIVKRWNFLTRSHLTPPFSPHLSLSTLTAPKSVLTSPMTS